MMKHMPARYQEGVGWLVESELELTNPQLTSTRDYIKKVWIDKLKGHLSVDLKAKINRALVDLQQGKIFQVHGNGPADLFKATSRLHPEKSYFYKEAK